MPNLDIYGLYPATSYQRALGDEPEQLRHLKFQEMLAIQPPAAFTALWQDDVGRAKFWRSAELRAWVASGCISRRMWEARGGAEKV